VFKLVRGFAAVGAGLCASTQPRPTCSKPFNKPVAFQSSGNTLRRAHPDPVVAGGKIQIRRASPSAAGGMVPASPAAECAPFRDIIGAKSAAAAESYRSHAASSPRLNS